MRATWLVLGMLGLGACTGASDDVDGDGFAAAEDCDDAAGGVHPGADELCNGIDDDCDGAIDEPSGVVDASTWYPDTDGDGVPRDAVGIVACEAPTGFAAPAEDWDCADEPGDEAIHPGAVEVCNGIDDDCDGSVDMDDDDISDAGTWYDDDDDDGFGDPDGPQTSCEQPDGTRDNDGDCDDGDAAVHPAAAETCNDVDDDCDGAVDDDDDDLSGAPTWYADADGDGAGDAGAAVQACTQPSGTVVGNLDCDDTDAQVNREATEVCDGIDNDCDGRVDDDDVDVVDGPCTPPDTGASDTGASDTGVR